MLALRHVENLLGSGACWAQSIVGKVEEHVRVSQVGLYDLLRRRLHCHLRKLTMLSSLAFLLLGCLNAQQSGEVVRPAPLRVITYNVHAWGPVAATDAGRQRARQMNARGQLLARLALELQLYDPDVIALQEAHSEARVKDLAGRLEMDYAYFPGGWKGKGWPEGISGAILSRCKIVAREDRPSLDQANQKEEVFSRCLGRVVIEHGGEPVAIYCAHLLPSWKDTTHIREAELRALTVATNKDLAAGRSVIVMGDMNHEPAAPEYRLWAHAGLVDTARQHNQEKVLPTCPSQHPKERIDYVFAGGPIARRLHCARALREGAFVVRKADASSYALSDHVPVLAVFR